MKGSRLSRLPAAVIVALSICAVGVAPGVATAQTIYGTLSNFDVINDTGGDCHGFEIELEGISVEDVVYTFGEPYQRYGNPTVESTGTGVIVRYASGYDGSQQSPWSATTPATLPPYLPTLGHSCWTGGVADPADYYNGGCDHFGVSLNASPTKTTYRWLVESGPGTLSPHGSDVKLPAPAWNVAPNPVPGAQPIAAAVIAPPAPDLFEFGDALWVKVYVTELPEGLEAEDLDHMVIDDPEVDIVPDEEVEIEIEWVLIQASTENEGEEEFGAEVGEGNEAVSRRFEFYEYVGEYDAETHEVVCDSQADCPDAVGEIIGAQNVAVNLLGMLPQGPSFLRGDADGNGAFSGLADALFSLRYFFTGGSEPPCREALDTDANGTLSGLQDTLYMLRYAFVGGPAPPAPFPTCGQVELIQHDCTTPTVCP